MQPTKKKKKKKKEKKEIGQKRKNRKMTAMQVKVTLYVDVKVSAAR